MIQLRANCNVAHSLGLTKWNINTLATLKYKTISKRLGLTKWNINAIDVRILLYFISMFRIN